MKALPWELLLKTTVEYQKLLHPMGAQEVTS